MVGAIPVGIETKGIADEPYWPNQICWTYKEVWTQPVGEWIWLMRDLSGPAVVRGIVDSGSRDAVRIIDESTHETVISPVAADGTFRVGVPQGRYLIEDGSARTSLTALTGGVYQIDLRSKHAVMFTASSATTSSGEIIVRASVEGAGRHSLSIRTDNLTLSDPAIVSLDLGSHGKQTITWHARVGDASTPWVAIVLRDGSLNGHAELSGVAKD